MTSSANAGMPEKGCGDRLREAREAAGLSVAEAAAKMHVPTRVIESLETEDWDRLGASVFVRGQLRSYAHILGLPVDALQLTQGIEPPQLKPRTFTSPLQRLTEQAARRMVYVVITAAIAVPVWMVTRQHVDTDPERTASLDIAAPAREASSSGSEPAARQSDRQRPFIASLTPLQSRKPRAPALSLRFSNDSWVEITAPDGSQLEQALIKAGERREYASDEVARIVLGNADAVEVRRYGRVQDTTPYRQANIVRFTVSSDGSLAPAAE